MDRIYRAFFNSAAGWRYALRNEKAVAPGGRVLALSLPASFVVTDDNRHRLALVGVLLSC